MAVTSVLFVHGYSETSLGSYFQFPRLLSEAGLNVQPVVLSAFDSLDDVISIADLAAALEDRVAAIERAGTNGWSTANCAVICHSTGALVARRWILDRIAAGNATIPSHLITMAGANHGSSLAQVGKSPLGYLQKLLTHHVAMVGARVLTDLDYGSDFLLNLNGRWIAHLNEAGSPLRKLYAFSMGGDFLGNDQAVKILWASSEDGSDNTVRISAANLNFRFLDADNRGKLTVTNLPRPVPHAVLAGYSHFGPDTGILGVAKDATDVAFQHVLEAIRVDSDAAYQTCYDSWSATTAAWSARPEKAKDVDATIVFSVMDRGMHPIDDCMIAFLDSSQLSDPSRPMASRAQAAVATTNSSAAILPHSPIHNNAQTGSYSFYINWPRWQPVNHVLHIEAQSPSPRVGYKTLDYQVPPEVGKLVHPNEFTYVRLTLESDTDSAYALYGYAAAMEPLSGIVWTPDQTFPAADQIP